MTRQWTRREILAWWRHRNPPEPRRAVRPEGEAMDLPIALPVTEPVWLDAPAPFSLEAFYAARARSAPGGSR